MFIEFRIRTLNKEERKFGYEYREYLSKQNEYGMPQISMLGKSNVDILIYFAVIGLTWKMK